MKWQASKVFETTVFLAMLALVTFVLVYSPLRYHFIYPTAGDDTAFHMQALTNLTADFGYISKLSYYGYVLLLPFTWLGLSPVTVFSIFNYAVMIAVFISLWILLRKRYGLLSAVLSYCLAIFVTSGNWYYFNDGTIFNILNLFVAGIMAIYCLCQWLECGKYKWLAATGVLFIITSLVHSTTYLYLLVSMLLFLPGCLIFYYVKKNRIMLQRTLLLAGIFSLSILTAGFTWLHKQLPWLGKTMVAAAAGAKPAFAEPSGINYWMNHYLNPVILLILALAILLTVALISSKNHPEERQKALAALNQPLSYLLLIIMLVLAVGAFTNLGYYHGRFMRDLATFVSLSTAILLGVALTHYRQNISYVVLVLVIYLMSQNLQPINKWMSDYTALRPCDVQAIEFLNSIPAEELNVQASSNIAPWIYKLYTGDGVSYTSVSNLDKYKEADYLLYRNYAMTWGTGNFLPKSSQGMPEKMFTEVDSLVKVAEFQSGNKRLTIYKVEK